jgi:hypothetical protein
VYAGIIVACIGVIYLVAVNIVLVDRGNPNLFHVEDYFTDFDSDGDIDHVLKADVVFNCGGIACALPTPSNADADAFYPEVVPTFPAGLPGGIPDGSDPDAGGGGGPPPQSTGGVDAGPPATATATPEA